LLGVEPLAELVGFAGHASDLGEALLDA